MLGLHLSPRGVLVAQHGNAQRGGVQAFIARYIASSSQYHPSWSRAAHTTASLAKHTPLIRGHDAAANLFSAPP